MASVSELNTFLTVPAPCVPSVQPFYFQPGVSTFYCQTGWEIMHDYRGYVRIQAGSCRRFTSRPAWAASLPDVPAAFRLSINRSRIERAGASSETLPAVAYGSHNNIHLEASVHPCTTPSPTWAASLPDISAASSSSMNLSRLENLRKQDAPSCEPPATIPQEGLRRSGRNKQVTAKAREMLESFSDRKRKSRNGDSSPTSSSSSASSTSTQTDGRTVAEDISIATPSKRAKMSDPSLLNTPTQAPPPITSTFNFSTARSTSTTPTPKQHSHPTEPEAMAPFPADSSKTCRDQALPTYDIRIELLKPSSEGIRKLRDAMAGQLPELFALLTAKDPSTLPPLTRWHPLYDTAIICWNKYVDLGRKTHTKLLETPPRNKWGIRGPRRSEEEEKAQTAARARLQQRVREQVEGKTRSLATTAARAARKDVPRATREEAANARVVTVDAAAEENGQDAMMHTSGSLPMVLLTEPFELAAEQTLPSHNVEVLREQRHTDCAPPTAAQLSEAASANPIIILIEAATATNTITLANQTDLPANPARSAAYRELDHLIRTGAADSTLDDEMSKHRLRFTSLSLPTLEPVNNPQSVTRRDSERAAEIAASANLISAYATALRVARETVLADWQESNAEQERELQLRIRENDQVRRGWGFMGSKGRGPAEELEELRKMWKEVAEAWREMVEADEGLMVDFTERWMSG